MFLDFAENRARQRRVMHKADWEERLVAFLDFNEMEILQGSGKVTRAVADALAYKEYEAFNSARRRREAIEVDEADIRELAELIDSLPDEDLT